MNKKSIDETAAKQDKDILLLIGLSCLTSNVHSGSLPLDRMEMCNNGPLLQGIMIMVSLLVLAYVNPLNENRANMAC